MSVNDVEFFCFFVSISSNISTVSIELQLYLLRFVRFVDFTNSVNGYAVVVIGIGNVYQVVNRIMWHYVDELKTMGSID